MEQQLLRVFDEAKEVRGVIETELEEYDKTRKQMNNLERQNLVLWKYIQKLNNKKKKERQRAKRRREKARAKVRAETIAA